MLIKMNDYTKFGEYKKEIEKIVNSSDGTTQDLKDLVEKRMNLKKEFNLLKQTFSKQSLANFTRKFFDVFKLEFNDYGFDSFQEVLDDDALKSKVLSKFNDKRIKFMNTDMVVENYVYVDHMGYKSNKSVGFKVLCDMPIDESKVYTKKEVLELYNAKKLLIIDKEYSYTDQMPNMSENFNDFYTNNHGYGFPEWYEQPLAMSIIKVDPKFRKMMFVEYAKYSAESKELAKMIKEVLPCILSRQKDQMSQRNEKFLLDANKEYSIDVKKAKAEYDKVVKNAKKVLAEKESKVQKEEKEMQKSISVIETYIR